MIGTFAGLALLILLIEPLSRLALAFRPEAYFALGVLGLSVIASVSEGSLIKGAIAAMIGLVIATFGTDPVSGVARFNFGSPDLLSGVPFVLVMIGLFAVSELLGQIGQPERARDQAHTSRFRLPSFGLQKTLFKANAIGAAIGAFCGLMPGAGGTVASFMA